MKQKDNELYYRWLLINNQETAFLCIEELLPGFYKTKEEVVWSLKLQHLTDEYLFSVRKIEESGTPYWIAKHLGACVE